MTCYFCKLYVYEKEISPMMEKLREFYIKFTFCVSCHNNKFPGVWCVDCNTLTLANDRPIIYYPNSELMAFACKKCNKLESKDSVIITHICNKCKNHLVITSENKIIYGPEKCISNEKHEI